ncbi:fam-a protein [Plasmodium vinckei brucechwatti]|uniref:Fam-a protein n=1 Tax=Plasmodium vinckei brucechwatti TaxID=119398 RepID=A0A6V7RWH5_PLAVN|nr:fam-a protein [Plasmodium vinckei brucechwatti]
MISFHSIFAYANNKTLATETAPEENTKTKSTNNYSTPEEIYKQNKGLLCTNSTETINAEKLMNEAATQLEHHAKNKEGYKLRTSYRRNNGIFSIKEHENTVIQRIHFKYYLSSKYNEIINMLWDPALANHFNKGSVERKIVRVYNPNLVMIQQRYKKSDLDNEKYFYALAAKIDVRKYFFLFLTKSYFSHNSQEEYENKIIENANLFKTDIKSENDIRNGKLKKTFVNIAGYLLEKTGAYIDGHTSNSQELYIEKGLNKLLDHKNWSIWLGY